MVDWDLLDYLHVALLLIFQMAVKLLPALQIFLIFCATGSLSYPNAIYGTKRYGRSASRLSAYDTYPYQTAMLRTQRYPLNYYKLYPYSQAYPEDYYYPQESYPVYYPAPRTSKYEVYQAVLPYYYQERPVTRPAYSYYGYADPMVDLQEEMIQEAEREEREEAQPIGHESYYENDNGGNEDEALDEVNAAFLQNLILSQMYQDSVENEKDGYDQYAYNDYDGTYGKFEDPNEKPSYSSEDEDVRELKQLTKQHNRNQQFRNQDKTDGIHWFQNNNKNYNRNENKRSNTDSGIPQAYSGLFTDRKPIIKPTITTTQAPSTTTEVKKESRGQKEEFQMRPATPVRNPFSNSVLNMFSRSDKEKKRTPSVYDTIKHMLDVEKSLENVSIQKPCIVI